MTIDAVLFAAGRGERLRPITDTIPKPGVPVLDVPLGAWGKAALVASSQNVVMNVSHLAEDAARLLGDGLEVFVEPPEPFGTAGTLRALADRLGDEVAFWNGDLIADIDMAGMRSHHRSSGRAATLVVRSVARGGDMTVAGDRATGFIDRRRSPDAPGALFLGAGVLARRAIEIVPARGAQGLGEAVIAPLIAAGQVAVVEHTGYAIDVGTPNRYLAASLDVLAGRAPAPPEPIPGDIIEVPKGRAYVGPGADHAGARLADGAILLGGARLAGGTSVTDSVVFPGAPASGSLDGTIWLDGPVTDG